jgi:hypothetical protein
MSITGFQVLLSRSEFVDKLFKPELICLVNNDEEHLIMFWPLRKRPL